MDYSKIDSCRILMFPWLAHGHVSPFLELTRKLVERKFQVIICSTPVNLSLIRETLAEDNHLSSIKFIDIRLPTSSELPPEFQTTKNAPPQLVAALMKAFDGAKDHLGTVLRKVKPDILIYDYMQPWAAIVAQEEGIPAMLFITSSAIFNAVNLHLIENPSSDYPLPGFPKSMHHRIQFLQEEINGLASKYRIQQSIQGSLEFVLIRTLSGIDDEHVAYLSKLAGKEVLPLGPLVRNPKSLSTDLQFMNWLSNRDRRSVVFVSFGSEYFLSKEEIRVMASGLEKSMVSFICVIRFQRTENLADLNDVLPEGFRESVSERGLVVKDWAPQLKILSHPSVGGFVSHCGWSSILESTVFGVPIIAMPMANDQAVASNWAVEIGIAVEVPKENGKYGELEIVKAIKHVVVEEEGRAMRKRAQECSNKIKQKGDQEIDQAVMKLLQLVKY